MLMPNITIVKASGEKEPLDLKKVARSMQKAGASDEEIKEVLKELIPDLKKEVTTHEIYKKVYELLSKIEDRGLGLAGRYSLKKAIQALGPSGYPFEKYVAGVLKQLGYETKTNLVIKGHCVSHEIDVLAKKDNQTNIIEAKFHAKSGFKTDIKTALYVYARFLDLKNSQEVQPNPNPWLVTNTKVTSEVKSYSECNNLKVMSWNYPEGFSLRELSDKANLHPITALISLDQFTTTTLLNNGIVFCTDIKNASQFFQNQEKYQQVLKEAEGMSFTP
ncbi:hypothetical protein COV24_01680 [candidate division WWE3 bacterium CG10_big_fil_rev_8_21_14_0_10_32_10]|uniref:ATP-cone domain-containing protein n=1 Tax=candidate division WWE3 bacterium CG10_big_fil_rev_8_21_14_0_10_32_10 TaxID=1975090 RepID=A0A2H0RAZ0_UNCKA|nr:MAG: hypothetical protein COV24_01680 [candidate division WWE3 bacterium CG10_big_fil_rev_8_21_14_0_10_32_10]